jgi:hypothetical protein
MNELVDEMLQVVRELADEKGKFRLFALFLREEGVGKWDVVASAPWIDVDRWHAIEVIVASMKKHVAPERMLMLSRVAPVQEDAPAVVAINRAIRTQHSAVEFVNSTFFDMPMRHAYILVSDPMETPVTAGRD